MTSAEVELCVRLCAAWPELGREELAAMFTDDAVYRNVPWPRDVVGGQAIADVLCRQQPWKGVDCNILSVSAPGGTIFVERLEVFHLASGQDVELPVVGAFDCDGGRISGWRDYFDPGPFRAIMGGASA